MTKADLARASMIEYEGQDGDCLLFSTTLAGPGRIYNMGRPRLSPRPPICKGDVTLIPLTKGKFAMIDSDDWPIVAPYRWVLVPIANGKHRASASSGFPNGCHSMHRMIMNAPAGVSVDHINGDTLDNRRSNLRLATHAENSRNRVCPQNSASGKKGVTKRVRRQGRIRWQARICVDGVTHCLGDFLTLEDAARAYDSASLRFHGEFARPNDDQT